MTGIKVLIGIAMLCITRSAVVALVALAVWQNIPSLMGSQVVLAILIGAVSSPVAYLGFSAKWPQIAVFTIVTAMGGMASAGFSMRGSPLTSSEYALAVLGASLIWATSAFLAASLTQAVGDKLGGMMDRSAKNDPCRASNPRKT